MILEATTSPATQPRHSTPAPSPRRFTGKGFIPGRSPDGTTILDGFGVYPPLPGQYGATSGPYADPASTVPGQTWDDVTATLTGPRLASPRPFAVSGPNGNGTVTVTIDTTGMAAGTYTVTITGRLLTPTTSFQVKSLAHRRGGSVATVVLRLAVPRIMA